MFTKIKKLPSYDSVITQSPPEPSIAATKARLDRELAGNMRSRKRFVVVVGPCSADDPSAVETYCQKLARLQDVYPELMLVVRVYTTKPHTNGQGYQGLCFHSDENAPVDIPSGILTCRKMMQTVLGYGLPIADELLYPDLYQYFADLVSYWFVGARSSQDSLHRQFASGLDVCCGVKNSTDGSVFNVVNNLMAVASPCVFPFGGQQLQTGGNNLAHVVLRGGLDKNGKSFCNLDEKYIAEVKALLQQKGLNDFVMADLSHDNSGKDAQRQTVNAQTVVGNKNVNGVMVESYLFGGKSKDAFGVSKTDACLSFDDTKYLVDLLSKGFTRRS